MDDTINDRVCILHSYQTQSYGTIVCMIYVLVSGYSALPKKKVEEPVVPLVLN